MAKEVQENTEVVSESVATAIKGFDSYLPAAWLPYWEKIQAIPFVGFFVLLVVGYLLAKLVAFVFAKSFGQISKKTKTEFDEKAIRLIKWPLFLTVFFIFIGLAISTLPLSEKLFINLVRILVSLILIIWITRGFSLLRVFLDSLSRVKEKLDVIQPKTIPLFEIIGKVLIIAMGSYLLLMVWGINPTAWLASAGVVGIAVGFAAKDSLANLFSGFFILVDSPYQVGDFINLESGERGQVTHVGLRSTRLLTRDDIEVTIPNNIIGNAKVLNESGGHWENSRIRISVGIAYGSDLDLVCETLIAIAQAHEDTLDSPEPRVRIRGLEASRVAFELLTWIPEPVLRGRVSHDLYLVIYKTFTELGIDMSFSKQDIYVKEVNSQPLVFEGFDQPS